MGAFQIFQEGSYFASEMRRARDEDRITTVRYDRGKGVVVAFDLGVVDSTAMWFAQFIGT